MRNADKRHEIFNYLKVHKTHLTLLQETHSCEDDERVWSNEWGNKIIYAHGNTSSRGVAVLIDKQAAAEVKIEAIRIDPQGRFLILDVNINNIKFVLVNVYGPNEDDPQFYTKVFGMVDARENASMIIAGDFNTSLDPSLDLFNNQGTNHTRNCTVLLYNYAIHRTEGPSRHMENKKS